MRTPLISASGARTLVMCCLLAWLGGALLPTPALAQEKSSREREALRRAQQALRSAKEESVTLLRDKEQLSAEKAALLKDKEAIGAEARRTAARVAATQAQAREAQAQIAQLTADLEAVRAELATAKAQQASQATELADSQRTVRTVRALLESSQHKQRILEARNQQLYDTGVAVVEMYRSRKPSESLAQQSQVLGLGIVDIENISEKWMDRLQAARYQDQDKLNP
jgi:chromosome segregation ATPase